MALVRAFEITNLVLNEDTAANADKYLIVTDGASRKITVPKNAGHFMNIYIGKEHKYSCQTAYNEITV